MAKVGDSNNNHNEHRLPVNWADADTAQRLWRNSYDGLSPEMEKAIADNAKEVLVGFLLFKRSLESQVEEINNLLEGNEASDIQVEKLQKRLTGCKKLISSLTDRDSTPSRVRRWLHDIMVKHGKPGIPSVAAYYDSIQDIAAAADDLLT